MSVALVHYHLRAGGVTRVLERQSKILDDAGISHVVLTGTPPENGSQIPFRTIQGLDYAVAQPRGERASDLLKRMRAAATEALGHPPRCWHLHNPTLGKNPHLPQLIAELAESQVSLVMHIHDLAEEGRPDNYRTLRHNRRTYPIAPQIHYLTINSKDLTLLRAAGIPSGQSSLLPNAVPAASPPAPYPPMDASHPLVLYPVRGIRRKNLGEFCLISGLAPEPTRFALALPPGTPQPDSSYSQWNTLARELRLPVQMGVVGSENPEPGARSSFPDWVQASTHFMTTSIAEGFGLSFLEAVTLHRPLLGRDLPEITSDFRKHGLDLGSLYDALFLPRTWIDGKRLRTLIEAHLQNLYVSCGESLPCDLADETMDAHFSDRFLDFGKLPEVLQMEVIPRAIAAPGEILCREKGRIAPVSEWLPAAMNKPQQDMVEDLSPWSLETYRHSHMELYDSLARCRPAKPCWLEPREVLLQYLRPERFHFLRS